MTAKFLIIVISGLSWRLLFQLNDFSEKLLQQR